MKPLCIVPCSIQDACEYVRQYHRHHRPPISGLFACGCAAQLSNSKMDDAFPLPSHTICGVAIVGRPVARGLQDGFTAEVTRVATDGTKNACSMLYAACWRAARALGYRKLVTYVLASETGGSVQAAGWKSIAEVRGRSWDCATRPRVDRHPKQDKIRWEISATS